MHVLRSPCCRENLQKLRRNRVAEEQLGHLMDASKDRSISYVAFSEVAYVSYLLDSTAATTTECLLFFIFTRSSRFLLYFSQPLNLARCDLALFRLSSSRRRISIILDAAAGKKSVVCLFTKSRMYCTPIQHIITEASAMIVTTRNRFSSFFALAS